MYLSVHICIHVFHIYFLCNNYTNLECILISKSDYPGSSKAVLSKTIDNCPVIQIG